jgi:hypothetical protein
MAFLEKKQQKASLFGINFIFLKWFCDIWLQAGCKPGRYILFGPNFLWLHSPKFWKVHKLCFVVILKFIMHGMKMNIKIACLHCIFFFFSKKTLYLINSKFKTNNTIVQGNCAQKINIQNRVIYNLPFIHISFHLMIYCVNVAQDKLW